MRIVDSSSPWDLGWKADHSIVMGRQVGSRGRYRDVRVSLCKPVVVASRKGGLHGPWPSLAADPVLPKLDLVMCETAHTREARSVISRSRASIVVKQGAYRGAGPTDGKHTVVREGERHGDPAS